jgi:hypothetical protein
MRYFRRRSSQQQVTVAVPEDKKYHRYAGYVLSLLVGGHAIATRIAPLVAGVVIDYSFASVPMYTFPVLFPIYYTILGCAGLYHLSWGALQALRVFGILKGIVDFFVFLLQKIRSFFFFFSIPLKILFFFFFF